MTLRGWFKKQGPGYRDFDKWESRADFRAGQRIAAEWINFKSAKFPSGSRRAKDYRPFDHLFLARTFGSFRPPTYLILERSGVGVYRPFPKRHGIVVVVHFRDEHPPLHFHIRIGNQETRYCWPQLRPYPGDPELSNKEFRRLTQYLREFAPGIQRELERLKEYLAARYPDDMRT